MSCKRFRFSSLSSTISTVLAPGCDERSLSIDQISAAAGQPQRGVAVAQRSSFSYGQRTSIKLNLIFAEPRHSLGYWTSGRVTVGTAGHAREGRGTSASSY